MLKYNSFVLFIIIIIISLSHAFNLKLSSYKNYNIRNVIVTSILSSALTFGSISIIQPLPSNANTGMITGNEFSAKETALTDSLTAAMKASSKTYSNNAKNMERISKGDYSMGSKQTSTSDKAKKRIAANACKSNGEFRNYAKVSEKQCNNRVFENDYQWVITALDELEKKK